MKFFRVAKAGPTIDGRNITPEQIRQMAANYDPKKKYNSRIWLEHLRGILPDSYFQAYGDVLALDVEEDGDDVFLLAALNPTSELVKMNQNRQKVHTSIELDPDFAGSGEAYCVGLAVTDSPASLGTEILKFSAQNPNAFNLAPEVTKNLRSESLELESFTCEDEATPTEEGKENGFFTKLVSRFNKHEAKGDQLIEGLQQDLLSFAETIADTRKKDRAADQKRFADLENTFNQLKQDHADLVNKLSNQPDQTFTPRPTADGQGDHVLSDF